MSNFCKILRRDLGAQFRQSRNLNENWCQKCCRLAWTIIFLFRGIAVGIKGMFHEQLGSHVLFQEQKYTVINWAGSTRPTLSEAEGDNVQQVDRTEIRNIVTLNELAHRFLMTFGWYMNSWHGIDVNRKLYPECYGKHQGC